MRIVRARGQPETGNENEAELRLKGRRPRLEERLCALKTSMCRGFAGQPDWLRPVWGVGGGAVRRIRTSLRSPYLTYGSGNEKATSLGESGGAGLFVAVTILEVAGGAIRLKKICHDGLRPAVPLH